MTTTKEYLELITKVQRLSKDVADAEKEVDRARQREEFARRKCARLMTELRDAEQKMMAKVRGDA